MPNTYFRQVYGRLLLEKAAITARSQAASIITSSLDHDVFERIFEHSFGSGALNIFDKVRVYRNPTTHQLHARAWIDGDSYKVWREDVWKLETPYWEILTIPEHADPAGALHYVVRIIGDSLLRLEDPVDLLDAAIKEAAHTDAAQPDFATATIAMLHGDLDATRLVVEYTFGDQFKANGLWTAQYEQGQTEAGQVILSIVGHRDEQYRLYLASTPHGWCWLVKRLNGRAGAINTFKPTDHPPAMYRRLLSAIGSLREGK